MTDLWVLMGALWVGAGHQECVSVLAEHGADVDLHHHPSGPPLCAAVANQHLGTARTLLQLGEAPPPPNETHLNHSINNQSLSKFNQLSNPYQSQCGNHLLLRHS